MKYVAEEWGVFKDCEIMVFCGRDRWQNHIFMPTVSLLRIDQHIGTHHSSRTQNNIGIYDNQAFFGQARKKSMRQ